MQFVISTFSQVVLALAVPYFLLTVVMGVRVARRAGSLRAQENAAGDNDAGDLGYSTYFLVPCLNEALVIGATVTRLLSETNGRVVVIDDGSDDDTAGEALRAATAIGASGRLVVHQRRLPDARHGKGAALNAGFRVLVEDATQRGLDPSKVIVGVMDADGRLSRGGATAPLRHFEASDVGGVQLIVRIRNRSKLITQFQDVEFWAISAVSQFARSVTGTVSLGGNGQFTRLSALQSLSGEPWSESLTEDLDLGLRLAGAGWRVMTTTRAFVDQQGCEKYRVLIRQRTRWYQGHMSSINRLPELWSSDRVGQVALIELTSYLLVPWVIVLPWSLIQQWILFQLVFGSGRGVLAAELGSTSARVAYGVLWYLMSFLPNIAIGLLYARRTRAVPAWRAFLLAHLMIAWNYVGYLAAWRALARMVIGRTGWHKTARTSEHAPVTLTALVPLPLPVPMPMPVAATSGARAEIARPPSMGSVRTRVLIGAGLVLLGAAGSQASRGRNSSGVLTSPNIMRTATRVLAAARPSP